MTELKTISNTVLFEGIEEILREGGSVTMRIKGSSMRPFVRNGRDTVTLNALPAAGLQIGMVVLFRYGDNWLLHRLRNINGSILVMKGDGNFRITEHVELTAAAGYASAIERNNRTIIYGSWRWKLLTRYSLAVKALRTVWRDICHMWR